MLTAIGMILVIYAWIIGTILASAALNTLESRRAARYSVLAHSTDPLPFARYSPRVRLIMWSRRMLIRYRR